VECSAPPMTWASFCLFCCVLKVLFVTILPTPISH
jgi:hypothetical protein